MSRKLLRNVQRFAVAEPTNGRGRNRRRVAPRTVVAPCERHGAATSTDASPTARPASCECPAIDESNRIARAADAASARACLRANNHRADAHCSALVDARTTPGEPRAGLGSDVPASHFRYHFSVAATRSAKPSSAAALARRLLSLYLSRNRRCFLAR